jgi:hypothetical protein
MATYTITLSDAEDKALHVVAYDAQKWIDNAIKERCRLAMEEIITTEVKRLLDAGEPIPSSRDEIVLAAPVQSAAERHAENEAAMLAAIAEKTQG